MISRGSKLAVKSATRSIVGRGGSGSTDDGRLEPDTNPLVAIRPLCLTKKTLMVGHEVGVQHWALVAAIAATCQHTNINRAPRSSKRTAVIADHPKNESTT